MYIRSRQEALDALSEILALPERTAQIVQITVRIALCLEADARQFLADCQANLIEGGLERMRQARREMLASLSTDDYDTIVIVDSERDDLLERVGTAMDTMRVIEIVREVFPELSRRHQTWELGRAVIADEAVIRESLLAAVKHRGNPALLQESQRVIEAHVEAQQPAWHDHAAKIRAFCQEAVDKGPLSDGKPSPADDVNYLFDIIAITDTCAVTLAEYINSSNVESGNYLLEIRRRIHLLNEAAEQVNN